MLKSISREFRPLSTRVASFSKGAEAGGGRLVGKVALITGAASGLGKATAEEFVRNGARVIIADVDSDQGLEVARSLSPSAHFVRCDVVDEAQVAEAVDVAMARHGKLDVMYNNAGITGPAIPPSITDLDLDEFDRVMRVNLRGAVAGIKHAARVMIPSGSGSILCTSSISGILAGLGPHPYTVSKFAIAGLVRSAAGELCGHGIRVNCISPAPVPTPMSVGQIEGFYPGLSREEVVRIINGLGPMKGAQCEEIDVARAALYLASDEAKYISGHNLVVDGGFSIFKNLSFPSPDQFMPGLLLSTMRALDYLGLDVRQSVISCFNGFALDFFLAEQCREGQDVMLEKIKAVLLNSAGFHGGLT